MLLVWKRLKTVYNEMIFDTGITRVFNVIAIKRVVSNAITRVVANQSEV